ncbi:hypothetical protein A2V68_02970 [candidate division Kazan bacterium RBG_13_50_9]|uniref:Uncharacterized protein n=1 Tax=candidate division Kazan bacterium RBG_13_50_9 TaxID=1798535 RepID=A0A1F4NUL1_UNCK3|nr:MAG: hypothetical protein A2V68_02970 [candidate division Kazan bacterium RBG_13_50_9]
MENEIVNTIANQVTETATTGFFERIFSLYGEFISIFPEKYQWIVSIVIILAVAAFLWNLIKRNWLWIVLLIILFPGILPVLRNIFNSLSTLLVGKPLP